MISVSYLGVSMYALELSSRPCFTPPTRIRIPDWKRQVEKAMRELEPDRLTARVYDAEWAIFQRWQELGNRTDHTEERTEIAAGVEELLSIKIHKLKWPDFRSNS
jgi:hypothetical protein